MKHTKGPWRWDDDNWIRASEPRMDVAEINAREDLISDPNLSEACANAARIVACVNGCDEAGIEDPGKLGELIRACLRIPHEVDSNLEESIRMRALAVTGDPDAIKYLNRWR